MPSTETGAAQSQSPPYLLRPPIEEVTIQGTVSLPAESVAELATIVGESSKKKSLHTFLGGYSSLDGQFNAISLHIDNRGKTGPRKTRIIFEQGWMAEPPSASAARVRDTQKIGEALAFLALTQGESPLRCHLDLAYPKDSLVDVGFALPFPFPFYRSDLQDLVVVNGIRLANAEGTRSVVVDRLSSGILRLHADFVINARIGQAIELAIESGQALTDRFTKSAKSEVRQ